MTVISSSSNGPTSSPAQPELRGQQRTQKGMPNISPPLSLNQVHQDQSSECSPDCSCVLTSRPQHQHYAEPPLIPFLDYKTRSSAPRCLGQCLTSNYGKIPMNEGTQLGYEPTPPCAPPPFWSTPQKPKKPRWNPTTMQPNFNSFAPPPPPPPPPPPVSQALYHPPYTS